jgi:hypothetical protein
MQLPGSGFRSVRGGGASARFAAAEAVLLRDLVGQVAELVGGGPALAGDPAEAGGAAGDAAEAGVSDPATAGPVTADQPAPDAGQPAPDAGQPVPDVGQLEEMFSLSDSALLPDDPVLARLLPDAYPDDTEAAGDFRRFTEQELRNGKAAAARTVLATLPEDGGRVRLSEEEAQVWLRALNDVRLALGVRLSITEDFDARVANLDPADPRSAYMWIYDWLTFLQETLVRALS